MTPKELLIETVEYYKNNPRGISEKGCNYFKDGAMCAVGRCLIDPLQAEQFGFWVSELILNFGMKIFKPEYQNIEKEDWKRLQDFHDNGEYWRKTENGNELTKLGLEKYDQWLKEYE